MLKLVHKDITTFGVKEDFSEEQDLFLVIITVSKPLNNKSIFNEVDVK